MKKRVLLIVLAMVLVAALSVGLTLAYLTAQDEVVNTFTVGKVNITLDETDVNEYGVKDGDTRVKANSYKLIPGHEYVKDPTVHVAADSEKCYVFVKVENGISAIEAADKTIENQITNINSWIPWGEATGVYYKVWTPGEDANLKVFDTFKIDGAKVVQVAEGQNPPDGKYSIAAFNGANIKVTAYAVQYDGFADNVAGAWAAAQEGAAGN